MSSPSHSLFLLLCVFFFSFVSCHSSAANFPFSFNFFVGIFSFVLVASAFSLSWKCFLIYFLFIFFFVRFSSLFSFFFSGNSFIKTEIFFCSFSSSLLLLVIWLHTTIIIWRPPSLTWHVFFLCVSAFFFCLFFFSSKIDFERVCVFEEANERNDEGAQLLFERVRCALIIIIIFTFVHFYELFRFCCYFFCC